MTGFLLDTSVLSVLGHPSRPTYGAALRWYRSKDEGELFTCTIVIGEIARGISRLSAGGRRERYRFWLHHDVLPTFGERILPFDLRAALQWGMFMGEGDCAGAIPSNDDTKIAAVASVHGLAVVSANERHSSPLGVPLINPFNE